MVSQGPQSQVEAQEPCGRFRLFRGSELVVVESSLCRLVEGGFYWGSLGVGEAHNLLRRRAVGTFLVRDSCQPDHLFTLSARGHEGPLSVRLAFTGGRFALEPALPFPCVVELLDYYAGLGPRAPVTFQSGVSLALASPLRKPGVPPLQALCRRNLVRTFGREGLESLPLSPRIRSYIERFPFKI
eukprot:gi/632990164/ref/XP_007884037.1/ PREDICTED: suppressor of cytokine signaling 1-like [Callorhinchus milii]